MKLKTAETAELLSQLNYVTAPKVKESIVGELQSRSGLYSSNYARIHGLSPCQLEENIQKDVAIISISEFGHICIEGEVYRLTCRRHPDTHSQPYVERKFGDGGYRQELLRRHPVKPSTRN